jgi:hypothetical protein
VSPRSSADAAPGPLALCALLEARFGAAAAGLAGAAAIE